MIYHHLIVIFGFLFELSGNGLELDFLLINRLFEESDLLFINVHKVVFGHFELMTMLILELFELSRYFLFIT